MLLAAAKVVLAMPRLPEIVEFETADGALVTQGGRKLRETEALVSSRYVVHRRLIKVADYGSVSHRKRVVLVCILRRDAQVLSWDMSAPTWGSHMPHCAADIAVPDVDVPEAKKCLTTELPIRYDMDCCMPAAKFGELMRVGRLAPGMGLSWNPHLCLHWNGSFNGPTGYGGGGTFPPLSWEWGTPIPWRRKPLTVECYCVAGCTVTLVDFLQQHGLDEAELGQAVNHGFPTAVSWALDASLGEWLQATGQPTDMSMRCQPPGEYVVKAAWRPAAPSDNTGVAGVTERGAESVPLSREPTADECLRTLWASDRDFTLPMHPGRHATDRENLQSSSISDHEWVQQFHFGILLDELERCQIGTGKVRLGLRGAHV